MLNWVIATRRPRRRVGEISAMYMGETTDAPPTPEPAEEAEEGKGVPVPGQGRADGRDEVEDGDHHEHGAAAVAIGRPAHDDRPDDRADQGSGHGEAEPPRVEVIDFFEPIGRSRDDGRVEAEQQASEGRNERAAEIDTTYCPSGCLAREISRPGLVSVS